VSRDLYRAQKRAGATYRMALACELERAGYAIDYGLENFRVAAIPRGIERLFSKRRQAIEAAAAARGYRTPKGMELAALRTRKAKCTAPREALFEMWRADARALGYELKRESVKHRTPPAGTKPQAAAVLHRELAAISAPSPRPKAKTRLARAAIDLEGAARAIDQPAAMPGLAVDLRQRDKDHSRG
jgi:hypothetical protein